MKKDGKWGVITPNGGIVIPCEYDELRLDSGKYEYAVANDGKWGMARKGKGITFPLEYEDAGHCDRYYVAKKDGLWAFFFDETGEQLSKFEYESYERRSGTLFMYKKGRKYRIYDLKARKIK
ncbi:MAG: WG repeat-containing protein [bacterium]|nr:WG repeat-containing protein [bacterium]